MSREKVAQGLDMSSRTVERWEKGETEPGEGDVVVLARVLGVSEDWLRTGTGPMHIDSTSRDYGTGERPAAGSAKVPIAGQGSPGYSVRTFTLYTEDDVNLLPAWAMPILMAASAIIVQSGDVERARQATERGRKYRLRLLFEDEEDPQKQDMPEPPQ